MKTRKLIGRIATKSGLLVIADAEWIDDVSFAMGHDPEKLAVGPDGAKTLSFANGIEYAAIVESLDKEAESVPVYLELANGTPRRLVVDLWGLAFPRRDAASGDASE
ncbi:MAG: hypothetical protein KDA57_15975 [Planctomycetales bacterium]|nr:hypothetical protein [Planctomycetales bacterium]